MRKTAVPANDDSQELGTPIGDTVSATSAKQWQRQRSLQRTAVVALMLVPSVAMADPLVTLPAPPFELPVLPPVSGTWTVMVGIGGAYTPDFEGARRSMLSPVPIFSIRRAGSTEQFRGPRDGASIALIDFGDLRAGPVSKFVASRKANSYFDRCFMRGPGASFATVVLAVSVSACAMLETRETKLQAVKTVGIVSAVGDEITFAKGGLTGLDNRSQRFPIGSWGLDDLIVQQVTAALNGRFQVQPVSYQRAAFAAIKDSPVAPVNLIRDDPFKKLVQTEVSPSGLDAYIVITKAKSNFGGGARKIEGIGFITYGTMMETYSQVHALYEIRVFDGKSFDVIEKMAAPPLDDVGAVRIAGPSRMIDESFSLGTDGPARNEKLHTAITDLVARSLSSTLSDMHLADVR